MSWTPNYEDREEEKGDGELVAHVRGELKEKTEIIEEYRDKVGLWAFETPKAIVTCKRYIYVNQVSCHDPAISLAEEKEKKLVMYVAENNNGEVLDTYYEFPIEIAKNGRVNIRKVKGQQNSDVPMKNFKIAHGKAIEPFNL